MSTYLVKRLDQAKLLTDPFKLMLLGRFAGAPVTTKQVADRIGEKAPRLYRHVDALVEGGLLELVEEKPKRGTIERYYRTVADRFEVDPDLFATGPDQGDEGLEMIRSIFRDTESDLVRMIENYSETDTRPEDLPMVAKVEIRGTPEEVQTMREKLEAWVRECSTTCGDREDSDDLVSYTGLLAFYPQRDDS